MKPMIFFKSEKDHFPKKTFSNIEKSGQSSNILVFAVFVTYYGIRGGTNLLREVQ